MDATERFLRACRRQPVDRPPVWLMRQAGRYQASYQAVRRRASFMELCRTPALASQVTVAAVDELGVDAAIVFSDILVPFEPMGLQVGFDDRGPHVGPPIRDLAAVERLRTSGVADELGYVYDAVRLIKTTLGGRVPLLGFSGAPFTLASYAVEGGSSRNHHELKRLMYAEPETLERLLDRLATVVSAHLRCQIEAGCDAVQLFDTWGGLLTEAQWRRFSLPYTARVLSELSDLDAPTIHFALDAAHLLDALAELPCQVLSVDWRQPLDLVAARVGDRFALQGNIDPAVLRAPRPVIERAVAETLEAWGSRPGLIVNLGHGITPDVTVEAARALVDAAKTLGFALGGRP